MNSYPSILITSNQKNIRFGAMPVRADIYGLKIEKKLPINETSFNSKIRPVYYPEQQFGNIFWRISQLKNDLSALVVGGGVTYGPVPINLLTAIQTLHTSEICGNIIDNYKFGAKPLSNVFSSRIFKSVVYLKEAYLNKNKKSVILGDRVLIRDKFLLDEKTKKVIKKVFYNGVLAENFNQSFAANKVAFMPTNNHMVAGGPLFKTSFANLKNTDIIAYIKQLKLFFKEDLEKLKNNPTLDPDLLLKRTNEIDNYINNIQSNLLAKNKNYITVDFCDFIVSVQKSNEPYYKNKDNKRVLAEHINILKIKIFIGLLLK